MTPRLPAKILVNIIQACVEPYTLETEFVPRPIDGYNPDELEEFIPTLFGLPAVSNIRLVRRMFDGEVLAAMKASYDGQFHVGVATLRFTDLVLRRTETLTRLRPLTQKLRLISRPAWRYFDFITPHPQQTSVFLSRKILTNARTVVIEYWSQNPADLLPGLQQCNWEKHLRRSEDYIVRRQAKASVETWARILPFLEDKNVNIDFRYLAAYNVDNEALQGDVDINVVRKWSTRRHCEFKAEVRGWRTLRRHYGLARPYHI